MSLSEALSGILVVLGTLFFLAGTVGLLRFPDVHSRLHAVTKADNLGLGLIVLGLIIQAGFDQVVVKLLLIWLLILLSSAVSSHLVARYALLSRLSPQRRKP